MRSFWKVSEKSRDGDSSTYFDSDEAGFREVAEIYKLVTEDLGQSVVLFDADDLMAKPELVMAAFCEAMGLAPHAEMTTWKAEMPEAWKKWPGWHDDAAKSTGFVKAVPRSGPPKVENPLPDVVTRG